jgi:glycosyltransferase involved in cell wall biosynthesis
MGGEAMKALQIFREMKRIIPQTLQITHERNRSELSDRLQLPDIYYVKDTWLSVALWRSVAFRSLLDVWFSIKAVRLAENILAGRPDIAAGTTAIIHQTEPNSPVAPRGISRRYLNVAGPINGNIYYPTAFRANETRSARLRRQLHLPLQRLQRLTYCSLNGMNMLFCAGGNRTRESLLAAGCSQERIIDTVDCGVPDRILDRQPVTQSGQNPRFIHFGRLVFHKGTALILEALAQPNCTISLDIVGRGPELDRCKALATELGLEDRVRFLDWYTSHEVLLDSFIAYRGVVLPSIEDANGIVVQEAMALGLPPVCLDWGGPQLLIREGESGFLVKAGTRQQIVVDLATRMQRLADDGDLASRMALAARADALSWRWSVVIRDWLGHYNQLIRSAS